MQRMLYYLLLSDVINTHYSVILSDGKHAFVKLFIMFHNVKIHRDYCKAIVLSLNTKFKLLSITTSTKCNSL